MPFRLARRFVRARAAPAGGARGLWGRGCVLTLFASFGLTTPGGAEGLTVPSGQDLSLKEVLLDDAPGALWVRFRFVAPAIARGTGSVTYADAAADMAHLCEAVAAPYLADLGVSPERVVVSLSDRCVEFGAQDPEATQFFEAYRLESARCILEEF